MQHEPGSPQDWLSHARSDLALAKVSAVGDVLLASLCYHAQQAVEKSIKAVLVSLSLGFPKTHSIERLIDILPDSILRPPELIESARLTAYATTFRYPGVEEPVTEEEYNEALDLAEAVLRWATDYVG